MHKTVHCKIFLNFVFAAMILCLSCEAARTEEALPDPVAQMPETKVAQQSEDASATVYHHRVRPDYVPKSLRELWVLAKLEGMMREPVNEPKRIFFMTEKERTRNDSFSLDTTRDGFMVNGHPVPVPSTIMRQLPVPYERGIAYATTEFITLLENTAKSMQKAYPGTIMYLGNLNLPNGGDIPYSVSHNSGRDGDIAFYLKDEEGKFANPVHLHHINRRFQSKEDGPKYTFDIEKNATLIETLLMQDKVPLQFIFVAKHLRTAIRRELVSREASEELLKRFDAVVNELASHDDHFHIRVYCSNDDICAGCIDKSIVHEWVEDYMPKREACIEKHIKTLSSKKNSAENKAVSLQRVSLLGAADQASSKIIAALSDNDVTVRSAAAIAAASLTSDASKALASRLRVEPDHNVQLILLDSLAKHDSEQAAAAIGDTFDRLAAGTFPYNDEIIDKLLRHTTHNPRSSYATHLLGAIQSPELEPRRNDLIFAFEVVSNTTFENQNTDDMNAWFNSHEKLARSQWLIQGFKAAGYNITGLQNEDIPLLLDAIDSPVRAVSFNAQLTLKSLGHLTQDSLDWTIADARWHYTRYFKRNSKKYSIDLSDRDQRGNKLPESEIAKNKKNNAKKANAKKANAKTKKTTKKK